MKKNVLILLFFLCAGSSVFSQSVGIGKQEFTPHSSAALEIKTTEKGLLIPRMTETERNAIVSPASGLLIYQNDSSPGFYFYDGSSWQLLGDFTKLTSGAGVPGGTGTAGDIYVDESTGDIYTSDGTGWTKLNIDNQTLLLTGNVLGITNGNTVDLSEVSVSTTNITEGAVSLSKLEGLADAQFIIGIDGTSANNSKAIMTGDISMTNTGVTTIGNDKVTTAKIADNNLTLAKLEDGAANQILTTDATGNPQYEDKSIFALSQLSTARILVGNVSGVATGVDLSGDATLNETGVLTIGNDKISTAKIVDDAVTTLKIVNNNLTLEKLEDGAANQILTTDGTGNPQYEDKSIFTSSNLSTARIFVGNLSGVAKGVDLSGDATLDETGVLTIGNDKVSTVKIADDAVTTLKIVDNNLTLEKLEDGAANQILSTDGTGNPQYEDKSIFTSSNLTTARIFVGNLLGVATGVDLSGDATLNETGVLTIGNDKVITTKILDANVTTAKIADGNVTRAKLEGLADAQFIVGTDGTAAGNSKAVMSGDVTMTNAGVATIGNDKVTTAKIGTAGAGDADKVLTTNSSGDPQWENRSTFTQLGTSRIYVGNLSGIATPVDLSGDATINITGKLTIANDAVTTVKILDGNVTTEKIADGTIAPSDLSDMGASTGQLLKYNGSDWIPSNMSDSPEYKGVWNASTNSPPLADGIGTKDDYYIVSVAGNQDLGSGVISFEVGDWVIYNGGEWEQITNPNDVNSVFGRKGVVTAQDNDYTWAQIDKTVSSIGDIADVGDATPTSGNLLVADGSQWQSISATGSIADGGTALATGNQIYDFVAAQAYISSEVDGSVSNEGNLTVGAGTASTSLINSNTSGSTDITLEAGSNITLSETGNTITIAADDDQELSLTGNTLSIENGNSVDLSPIYGITPSGPENPVTANVGDVFFNTTYNILYVYDGTSWVPIEMEGCIFLSGTSITLGNNTITETILRGQVNIDHVLHLIPGAAPASPSEGDVYMDAASHKLRCYDGTDWQDLW